LTKLQVSKSGRILRRIGLLLAVIGVAALFFLLGVVFRVLIGPVSLDPINGELRSALKQQLPGLKLRFDEAALEWSRDEGRINLVIFGTRVFDDHDRIIAQAPEAEIGLAAGPFILGKIVIRRIALVGVQLTLMHTREGTLQLGIERDSGQSDILKEIRDAITRRSSDGSSELRSFAIHRARLAFLDEETGAFVVAPEAELQIEDRQNGRQEPSLIAAIDAQLEISGKPAHLLASINVPHSGDKVDGDFSITNLSFGALAVNSKAFASLKPFGLTADASGSFTVVHGNSLRYADVGIGAFGTIAGFGAPLHLKSIRLVARYDGRTGRVLIDDAALDGDHIHAHLSGTSEVAFNSNGSLSSAAFSLAVDKLAANMPGAYSQLVNLPHVLLKGAYQAFARKLVIDQAIVSGGPLTAEFSGNISFAATKSPGIILDGKVDPITVRDLLRFWPFDVGSGAREWIQSNVSSGKIGPVMVHANIASGQLDQPALPEDALMVSFPIDAATVSYIHGLTPLTNARGLAQLSGDTFKANLTSASVGALAVTRGRIVIPNLHMHGMIGDMGAHVEGSLPDVLALADMKPLQYPSRFHVNAAAARGSAALDLDFHVPMTRNESVDRIGISVKAAVTGMSLALGPHMKITNGSATFLVDNSSLHATGTLTFGSTDLNVDWTESFKDSPVTTHVNVRGVLDDAARAALNLHTKAILAGPVGIVAELQGNRGSIQSAQIDADLTPATFSAELLNIKKPAGSPALARISARLDESGDFRSADFSVSGTALSAKGSAIFSDAGEFEHLDFASVRDGGFNDFALSISEAPASGLNVAISGRSADGTILGRTKPGTSSGAKQSASDSSEPFHVTAKLDRVTLREGLSLAPFALDISGFGQRPETLALSAMISRSAQVTASIVSNGSGRKLTLASSDAGLLLKGLFGFTSIKSGRLTVSADMSSINSSSVKAAEPGFSGEAVISDCTFVNQGFLTRLFSSGSLAGFVDLMRGQGIAIDKLQIPFVVSGDIIDIHDGRASGPSIGITTEGYIDRANNQISLQGAIAPLYGINGVLGAIPVLGNVLVSKKGEGIFGVTYRANGDADEPQVTVNPLAILAPGIFRRLFEGAAPSAPLPQAKSAEPPPRTQ